MARKALEHFAREMLDLSNRSGQAFVLSQDTRLRKAHFIIEELAALLKALAFRSEIAVLSALAELTYAVTRAAVVFDLPLTDGFEEVHSANMAIATEGKNNGSADQRADIRGVLTRYRTSQQEAKAREVGRTGL